MSDNGRNGCNPLKRWTVGQVTVTRIVEHESHFDMAGMFPKSSPEALERLPWLWPHFITPDGEGILSMHALVVDTPNKRIIVDTCVGNGKDRTPFEAATNLQTSFLEDLESAGFPRESIDVVICTHMHFDHVGWNTMLVDGKWIPTFPNARYLIGKTEFEETTREGHSVANADFDKVQQLTFADSLKPVLDEGLVDLVDENYRVCEEVSLVPTPGHTVGHVSVQITSGGKRAFITGDMTHHPCQVAHPDWGMPLDADNEQGCRTRSRVFSDAANDGALVIGTHWAGPTAGHVKRDGDVFFLECS